METLRAAYEMAIQNDGAPGVDGVTFEAIVGRSVETLLAQLRDELTGHTYQPLPARKLEMPKDGGEVRLVDWEGWSRPWRYDTLRLYTSYRVRRDGPKVTSA